MMTGQGTFESHGAHAKLQAVVGKLHVLGTNMCAGRLAVKTLRP